MKEHFQDYGVRKWAGDDLIDLQRESLDALQGLVEPYAPCIIRGCAVVQDGAVYQIESGLAALRGIDADGQACVKIVRVEAFETPTLPVYLSMACDQLSRAYADGNSKVIANNYIAVSSSKASDGALELTAEGGRRLVDTIGITKKLDRVGGEAKDTVVGFVEAGTRSELSTGSKLGVLFGQVKKWFSDLRALAFKDKVAKTDLDAALTIELDNKVAQVAGKGLSTEDFTTALLDKLNGIESGATKFALSAATADELGGVKLGSSTVQSRVIVGPYSELGRTYPVQKNSAGRMVVNVPWQDTVYSHPTGSGNNHVPAGGSAGQFLGWGADGEAKWSDVSALKLVAAGSVRYGNVDASGIQKLKVDSPFGKATVTRSSTGIYNIVVDEVDSNIYNAPHMFVFVWSYESNTSAEAYNVRGNKFSVAVRQKYQNDYYDDQFVFRVLA